MKEEVGYRRLRQARMWMGRDSRRNLSKPLAGTLVEGVYEVIVTEIVCGKAFRDVTFKEEGGGGAIRNRFWGRRGRKFSLDSRWKINVSRPLRGHIVEMDYGGIYHVVDLETGSSVARAATASLAYSLLRSRKLKIAYLQVNEIEEISDEKLHSGDRGK